MVYGRFRAFVIATLAKLDIVLQHLQGIVHICKTEIYTHPRCHASKYTAG